MLICNLPLFLNYCLRSCFWFNITNNWINKNKLNRLLVIDNKASWNIISNQLVIKFKRWAALKLSRVWIGFRLHPWDKTQSRSSTSTPCNKNSKSCKGNMKGTTQQLKASLVKASTTQRRSWFGRTGPSSSRHWRLKTRSSWSAAKPCSLLWPKQLGKIKILS